MQQDAGRNDGDRHPRQLCRRRTRDAVAQGVAQIIEAPDSANSEPPHEPALRVRGRCAHEQTGAPSGEVRVEKSPWFNDIEVADDGTIYATQTGVGGQNPDASTWQVWKIAPDGTASIFAQGAPLRQPNGVALDPKGNVVVANMGTDEILTFSRDGKLLTTERAAQTGSDGLVVMPDGTKYVSSVQNGGVSRIRPGQAAELIAQNIPSAASMCYDEGGKQLVIPMNPNNGLAFVPLK